MLTGDIFHSAFLPGRSFERAITYLPPLQSRFSREKLIALPPEQRPQPAWRYYMHAAKCRWAKHFTARSILNSEFHGRIVDTTTIGDTAAIIPEISGRAWITGTHQHMLDPDDPWPEGYRLSDTWPNLNIS